MTDYKKLSKYACIYACVWTDHIAVLPNPDKHCFKRLKLNRKNNTPQKIKPWQSQQRLWVAEAHRLRVPDTTQLPPIQVSCCRSNSFVMRSSTYYFSTTSVLTKLIASEKLYYCMTVQVQACNKNGILLELALGRKMGP